MAEPRLTSPGGTPPGPVLGETLVPYILSLAAGGGREAFARPGTGAGARWRRGEVLAGAWGVAAWLSQSGVVPGDRVILHGATGPAWVAAFYGCILRGAAAVPLDASLTAAEAAALAARVSPGAGLGDAAGPPLAGLAWRRLSGQAPPPAPGATPAMPAHAPGPDDVAQIVFTSGTTGRPRAVPITHRNMLASLHRIERGFRRPRRRWLVAALRPRILCLVPASHLFGQMVGIHLPVLMGLPVVFSDDLRPRALRETLRRERIMAALAVPRILRLVADDLVRLGAAGRGRSGGGWAARLRAGLPARRALGWRFSAWICGGAALDQQTDAFWHERGYVVVQGYGLTETAPIISVSHPFARHRGSVGRPLGGQEIKVGPGGELWVRGDNVAAGYLDDPEATSGAFQDGWLRTGDRVERDEAGRLFIRGRLKDVIVTADGTNVDPSLVEHALQVCPGVAEAACVARSGARGEEVHAVLVLASGSGPVEATAAAAVRAANARLPPGQRVQGFSLWHEAALPRTSLGKLRRAAVREALASGGEVAEAAAGVAGAAPDAAAAALASLTGREAASLAEEGGLHLDRDLGLGSLDRLDLLVRLEAATGRSVDEMAVASAATLADLRRALELPPAPPLPMPRWARRLPARMARGLGRALIVGPLFRLLFRMQVSGREELVELRPPFLLAASHLGHVDTPAVLLALPRRLRGRLAVAMATEHFPALFAAGPQRPGRMARARQWLAFRLAVLLFHAYPLPRQGGFAATLDYTAELAEAGHAILIFPEGRIRDEGQPLAPFKEGPARLAVRLGLPVVPVGLAGTGERLPRGARVPRPGRLQVALGAPIPPPPPPADAAAAAESVTRLTARLQEEVRRLEVRAARTTG